MFFTSPETNSKSAESMFVPGKMVLSSEGKLLQFSLDTAPQLEQTKRLAPLWITHLGALGPFSAKILRLLSNLWMRSVSFCASRLDFDLQTFPSHASKITVTLTFFRKNGLERCDSFMNDFIFSGESSSLQLTAKMLFFNSKKIKITSRMQ